MTKTRWRRECAWGEREREREREREWQDRQTDAHRRELQEGGRELSEEEIEQERRRSRERERERERIDDQHPASQRARG